MLGVVSGAIARSIVETKARLVALAPAASRIRTPDPDEKNPVLPIRPGVAAYLDSGEQSISEATCATCVWIVIAYAHGGRFRARSKHEQEVWNECSRLVGNAVVRYNALILSEALSELESRGEPTSAEVIERVSPVAWQHIDFYGRYRFDADFTPIDFARLRQQLSSEEVSRFYTKAGR